MKSDPKPLDYFNSKQAADDLLQVFSSSSDVIIRRDIQGWFRERKEIVYCFRKWEVLYELKSHPYFGQIEEAEVFWDIVSSICALERKDREFGYKYIQMILNSAIRIAEGWHTDEGLRQ